MQYMNALSLKDSMSRLMFWRPKPSARSSTARAVEPQRRQVPALQLSSTSQACNWSDLGGGGVGDSTVMQDDSTVMQDDSK